MATPHSGRARHAEEIARDNVERLPSYRDARGISIVAFLGDALVGENHAARMPPRQFRHALTDLTVAVHPQAQELGVGSRRFASLFETAARLAAPVTRIERVARTGNTAAIRLYGRLEFRAEGRLRSRVRLPDGRIEDDMPMARAADGSR